MSIEAFVSIGKPFLLFILFSCCEPEDHRMIFKVSVYTSQIMLFLHYKDQSVNAV